jgi:hypothetical protein
MDDDTDPLNLPGWTPAEWAEILDGYRAALAHNAAVERRQREEAERVRARREAQRRATEKKSGKGGPGLVEG